MHSTKWRYQGPEQRSRRVPPGDRVQYGKGNTARIEWHVTPVSPHGCDHLVECSSSAMPEVLDQDRRVPGCVSSALRDSRAGRPIESPDARILRCCDSPRAGRPKRSPHVRIGQPRVAQNAGCSALRHGERRRGEAVDPWVPRVEFVGANFGGGDARRVVRCALLSWVRDSADSN